MANQFDPLFNPTAARTPAQIAAAQGQGQIGGSYAGGLAPQFDSTASPIAASTIGTQPANLPAVPGSVDYSGLSTNGLNTVTANGQTLASVPPPTAPQAPTTSAPQSDTQGILEKYLGIKPPSASDQYNTDYAASGIDQKQADFNAKQQALLNAQGKLSGLNAQLAGINAQDQAIQIQAQQDATGRGITSGGQAPQTAEQLRANALKAIPIQTQALVAQAEVAAAQGNAALSQQILQQAQTHLDTMYQIHQQDATNQYNYQKDVIEKVYDFASKSEQNKLDALKTQQQQEFTMQQNQLNYAQSLATEALNSGQGTIAGKIVALDPKSPTYSKDLASLAGQITNQSAALDIQLKQAQLAKTKAETQAAVSSLPGPVQTRVQGVAGQFDSEQAVKNYQTSAEAIDALNNAGTSPTDDISRIYAFAKVMDPNSVVREGEYKTVQDYSTALIQRIGLKVKRVFDNSGFLTDEARTFMKTTLDNRLASSKKAFDNIYDEYGRRIDKITGKSDGKDYLTDYSRAFASSPTSTKTDSGGKVMSGSVGGVTYTVTYPK